VVVKLQIESERGLTTKMVVARVEGMSRRNGGASPLYTERGSKRGRYVIRKERRQGKDWRAKVNIRDGDERNTLEITVSGAEEEQMTGSWIEWMFRNFSDKGLKFLVDATGIIWTR
jgi:hypothetical protein